MGPQRIGSTGGGEGTQSQAESHFGASLASAEQSPRAMSSARTARLAQSTRHKGASFTHCSAGANARHLGRRCSNERGTRGPSVGFSLEAGASDHAHR